MYRKTDNTEVIIKYESKLVPVREKFQPYMIVETGQKPLCFSSDKARSAYLRLLREKQEFEEKKLK